MSNQVQRVPYGLNSGPEFIVRGMEPPKMLDLGKLETNRRRKTSSLVVVMLTGEKFEMICRPRSIVCRHVLELLVREGKLEDDFLFGLARPIDGDFVFLPPEMKLLEAAPSAWPKWGKSAAGKCVFHLHLRLRFFLPSLREVKNLTTRHLFYLQLRRNLLDRQIVCEPKELLNLGGLALQAEFGDFDESEHGTGAYFLLEHYLPEDSIEDGRSDLESRLRDLHRSRSGLDRIRAEYIFVSQVQMLPEYGSHHHAGLWTKKSGSVPVWVTLDPRGICLRERKHTVPDRKVIDSFAWNDIRRLSCDENHFRLVPRFSEGRKTVRYKFRMENKKSFFLFRFAAVHHRFSLVSRVDVNSLEALRKEFGSSSDRGAESKFYLEAGTEDGRRKKETGRKRSRIPGSHVMSAGSQAHVIEASIRSSDENFRYDANESMASRLADEFSAVSWAEERLLTKCRLSKAGRRNFGLRVTEGSNGGILAANEVGSIRRGDQLISVNGVCLLNLNYSKALSLIDAFGDEVEILVSRKCGSAGS